LYSNKVVPTISHDLIDAAVTSFLTFALEEQRRKKLLKIK